MASHRSTRSTSLRPQSAFLSAVLIIVLQISSGAAFDVSYLQGCPDYNNVTSLDLWGKQLAGPIPPEIGKCTALVSLNLSVNYVLSGRIPPEIGRLSNLRVLKLAVLSKLEGAIPPELGNLSQLEELDLSSIGSLSGPIPPELCQLSKLQKLALPNTNLTGPIPDCLGNLPQLKELDLSGAWGLHRSGQTLGLVSRLTNLTSLKLSNASIAGPLLTAIANLTALQKLDLSSNNLSSISSVCQLSNLVNLDLGYNNLQAEFPVCLGNLSKLSLLTLSKNRLSGPIPRAIALLPNLTYLALRSNLLSGTIPAEFGQARMLSNLNLIDNRLTGAIPPELSNITTLTSLELSNNQLSGPVPALANMPMLSSLKLDSNNLSGPIPPLLGTLSVLRLLNLSSNQLSGKIPSDFSKLQNLGLLDLSYNSLQGPVTPLANFSKSGLLYLQHNELEGPIPPNFFVGKAGVHLSHNRFSGAIPAEVGKMSTESILGLPYLLLDLSSNELSGSPPLELQQLPLLSQLNLSNNNLSGSFRVGPFRRDATFSSLLDFSNNGPLAMLPGTNFSGLQIVALPNLTSRDPPLIAPDLRLLQLSGGATDEGLDLSNVPASCPYVTYSRPVSDITFWDACTSSTGCLVNLVGTGAKLSRSTRKTVCLNRISVFLEGDPPTLQFPLGSPLSPYLNNSRGPYFFNDSRFIDKIDLGPGGVAYTGVGFARVQAGNLCGNPEAKTVVAVAYGVFSGLVLLSALGWWIVARSGFLMKTGSSSGQNFILTLALYTWGLVSGLLPWADLATDIAVVADIWGVWSAWVVLGAILAPYLISAACIACVWWADPTPNSIWEARFKWVWFADLTDAYPPTPLGKLPAWRYPLALASLPAAAAAVVVYDVLGFLDRVGFHLRWGPDVYTLRPYSDFRAQLELTLRSIPQALFQSVLYLLGSSRSTRIYIDQHTFTLSIAVSLLSILVQFNLLLKETLESKLPVATIMRRRFLAANCRPCLMKSAGEAEDEFESPFESVDEKVVP